MTDRTGRGYVYVANTKAYLSEALASLRSLRAVMPGAAVALIAPRSLWGDTAGAFDYLIEPSLDYKTPIVKNDAYLAPFDEVAFVDTDTLFLGDHSSVFDVLASFDIAAAQEPTRGWGYHTVTPKVFCELNTGLIVFRNSSKVRRFFTRWLHAYQSLVADQELYNDQPSFRQALWESPDIRVAVLPNEFHAIVGKPCAISWDALLIHGRVDLVRVGQLINARLGYRAYLPGVGCTYPFSGRRQLLNDWIRLSLGYLVGFLRPRRSFDIPQSTNPAPHCWALGETDDQ